MRAIGGPERFTRWLRAQDARVTHIDPYEPEMILDTPDAASTAIRLGAGTSPGAGRALLQLTLTDAVGRSANSQVAVQVGNPVGLGTLLYVTIAESAFTPGETHLYTEQTGQLSAGSPIDGRPRVGLTYAGIGPAGARWTLDLAAQGNAAPGVGSYSGAWDRFSLMNGDPAATSMLTVGGGVVCGSRSGRFQVLDIAFDASGILQRLAVDFEQPCDVQTNNARTVRGAVRINSTLGFAP